MLIRLLTNLFFVAAVDMVVDLVLSLKVTGQHVSLPIRVQTRTVNGDTGPDDDLEDGGDEADYEAAGGLWPVMSWLHAVLLLFVTIMLLLAGKTMFIIPS